MTASDTDDPVEGTEVCADNRSPGGSGFACAVTGRNITTGIDADLDPLG